MGLLPLGLKFDLPFALDYTIINHNVKCVILGG